MLTVDILRRRDSLRIRLGRIRRAVADSIPERVYDAYTSDFVVGQIVHDDEVARRERGSVHGAVDQRRRGDATCLCGASLQWSFDTQIRSTQTKPVEPFAFQSCRKISSAKRGLVFRYRHHSFFGFNTTR